MSIAEKFAAMEYGPAPEDAKEALTWLDQHSRRFGHFINGTWLEPSAGEYFDTTDPSTGEKLASVAQGSPADIDAAVKAARAVFPVAKAGAIFQASISSGKFHGMICPTTPQAL